MGEERERGRWQVGYRRCAALVREVVRLESAHRPHELVLQEGERAVALRSEVDLAVLRFEVGDQLDQVLCGHRGIGDEDMRHVGHQAHRDEILLDVVAELGIQAHAHRMRGHGGHEKRIAVGRGLGGVFGADVAARTRPVVADNRPAPARRCTPPARGLRISAAVNSAS